MTDSKNSRKSGETLRQKLLGDIQTPILAHVNTSENAKMDRVAAEKAWMKDYREFGAAGIHVYHAHVLFTKCWLGIKQYDWTELDKVMANIIEGDPKARIILRLSLRTPKWWHERNPGQNIVYHDGSTCVAEEHHWNETVYPTSLASKVWMDDVQVLLRDTVAHVEASPHAGHVIGYNPALMHGGEWFEYGALYGKRADFSPVMRDAFRSWLDVKYPGEDHSNVEIPTVEERSAGDIGHLRHPVKSRFIIDHYEFYNERVAEDAERCCRTIKEAVTKDALVGIYYGYTFECAVQYNKVEDFGHLALRRILHSPYVDFLSTMNHYWDRPLGGFSWSFGPLADSCRVHDMLFFGEDENMTWLNRRNDSATEIYVWRAPDADAANNIFKRSFACLATHGQHEAIADLNGGWYDDPQIMQCIRDMARITREEKLDLAPVAEVAVLVDEVSCMYQGIGMANHLNTALLVKSLRQLFHMGAPTEYYLFSDLIDGFIPLERFKFIVVLNAFRLTREQREYIRSNVQKNGRHILWHYAPGFITEDDASVDHIRDLIGIDVACDMAPSLLQVEADGETFAADADVSPTFYITDRNVEVLGRMSNGKIGLCSKKLDDSVSIYSAAPRVPAAVLQKLARKAGVHIYCEPGNLIHASRGLVAIHAGSDGPKRIVLPRRSDLKDLFQEGDDATNVDEITLDLKLGKTKFWMVRPV